MKNSLLLKIATGLCVANVLFALWSSWTLSNARSRLSMAENTIREAGKSIESVRSNLATETRIRETEIGGLKTDLKAVKNVLDSLPKVIPQGK